MNSSTRQQKARHILIFGLGSHGGGLSAALYFARHHHHVTITDTRGPEAFVVERQRLEGFARVSWHLGKHLREDIEQADLILKNPAVPPDLPLLDFKETITSDIAYLLSGCQNDYIAVTGTKGKSTTASLLAHIYSSSGKENFLGGNIGRSPFEFFDELTPEKLIVLELSSWQIRDLALHPFRAPRQIVFTPLYPDHQNSYRSIEDYIQDKLKLFGSEQTSPSCILPAGNPLLEPYIDRIKAKRIWFYGSEAQMGSSDGISFSEIGFTVTDGQKVIYRSSKRVPRQYHPAFTAAFEQGIDPQLTLACLRSFRGVPHRLERIEHPDRISIINDTSATIPQAVCFSMGTCKGAVHLICGGTDKALDASELLPACRQARSLHLLSGSFTSKLIDLLAEEKVRYHGPFSTMEDAVRSAFCQAKEAETILLSPGAASFELFAHEFDRGDRFKEAVSRERLRT